jgi:hypothetical protein
VDATENGMGQGGQHGHLVARGVRTIGGMPWKLWTPVIVCSPQLGTPGENVVARDDFNSYLVTVVDDLVNPGQGTWARSGACGSSVAIVLQLPFFPIA